MASRSPPGAQRCAWLPPARDELHHSRRPERRLHRSPARAPRSSPRRREQHGVEAVQHAAVGAEEAPGVLHLEVALDRPTRTGRPPARRAPPGRRSAARPSRSASPGRGRRTRTRAWRRGARHQALERLVGRDLRRERRAAVDAPAEVGAGVADEGARPARRSPARPVRSRGRPRARARAARSRAPSRSPIQRTPNIVAAIAQETFSRRGRSSAQEERQREGGHQHHQDVARLAVERGRSSATSVRKPARPAAAPGPSACTARAARPRRARQRRAANTRPPWRR